jgi:hypothetical protein
VTCVRSVVFRYLRLFFFNKLLNLSNMIYYKSIVARKILYFSREGWKPGEHIWSKFTILIKLNEYNLKSFFSPVILKMRPFIQICQVFHWRIKPGHRSHLSFVLTNINPIYPLYIRFRKTFKKMKECVSIGHTCPRFYLK